MVGCLLWVLIAVCWACVVVAILVWISFRFVCCLGD